MDSTRPETQLNGIARVEAILEAAGLTGRVRRLEDSARTAAEAAAAVGCEVGAIANSLVFDADGEAVLVVTSGANRVNTDRVAELLGVTRLRRATPDFVRQATGFVIGGVAPVGHTAPVRTVLDGSLGQYDTVWAAAGHPHAVFSATFAELQRLTGAPKVNVT